VRAGKRVRGHNALTHLVENAVPEQPDSHQAIVGGRGGEGCLLASGSYTGTSHLRATSAGAVGRRRAVTVARVGHDEHGRAWRIALYLGLIEDQPKPWLGSRRWWLRLLFIALMVAGVVVMFHLFGRG
jgi:hypothetical protein